MFEILKESELNRRKNATSYLRMKHIETEYIRKEKMFL